ncbi:MAG: carbon storage regulator [Planctomycetaceae bacterium]|nr:carbon storage regulator [Planctomycetaceae bacterium]MCA9030504.1 carbon storage regulator [Planctomycetaceae bacterium]MCA9044875.1 carbon storage regulator [Planctomycetaceae bacterium]MCB9949507.1 carbon storage regulator [Planctomycetaceae bacterium]
MDIQELKVGESLMINGVIRIQLVGIVAGKRGDKARIGIEAPRASSSETSGSSHPNSAASTTDNNSETC